MYQVIKDYLDYREFRYEPHDEKLYITLTVHGDDLPQPTIIQVLDERKLIHVISPIPGKIPEDKRMDAAVAVAVANSGMVNGAFDLDMGDGEICFRINQSFRGCNFTKETAHYLLSTAFFTTDHYNERFFMLGKGMMSIEQFIEKENG